MDELVGLAEDEIEVEKKSKTARSQIGEVLLIPNKNLIRSEISENQQRLVYMNI